MLFFLLRKYVVQFMANGAFREEVEEGNMMKRFGEGLRELTNMRTKMG